MQEVTEVNALNIKGSIDADDYAFIVDTVGVNDEVQRITLNNIDFSDRLETITTSALISGDGTSGSALTLVAGSLTSNELAPGSLVDGKVAANAITLSKLNFSDTPVIGEGVVYGSTSQFTSTPVYSFSNVTGSGVGVFSTTVGTTAEFKSITASGSASLISDANTVTLNIAGSAFSPKTNIDLGTITTANPNIVANDNFVIETAGNLTINNPGSYTGTNGKFVVFKIKQGTGAPHTVSWGTAYDFQDYTPTYSTVATNYDVYVFQVDETNSALRVVTFNTGFEPELWSPLNLGTKLRAWVKPDGGYVDLANNVADVTVGASVRPSIISPTVIVTSDVRAFSIAQVQNNIIIFPNAQQLLDNTTSNTNFDTFYTFGLEVAGDNQYAFHMPSSNNNSTNLAATTFTQTGTAGVDFELLSRKGNSYTGIVTERADNFYIFSSQTSNDTGYINGSLVTNTNTTSDFSNINGLFWSIGNAVSGDGTASADFASNSEILELIVTDSVTQTERELVEGYLAWRANRLDVLPGGHPYKTVKPVNP